MLTADATPEAKENCKNAGADAFLTKPINSRALLEKVAQLAASLDLDPITEEQTSDDSNDELLDIKSLEQLAQLGDADFLTTLVDSFKEDARKHIGLIKLHCHDDYLTLRESLHALRLASLCAQAEQVKPDELGQEYIQSLAAEIERLFNETIIRLEKKFIPSRHDHHQHTH
jgi:two-component system sensor histidine kinase RpfC